MSTYLSNESHGGRAASARGQSASGMAVRRLCTSRCGLALGLVALMGTLALAAGNNQRRPTVAQNDRPSAGRNHNPREPATTPQPGGDPSRALVERCRITLIHDVQVPAQEAGQLMVVEVREGQVVEEDGFLARIDDRQAQQAKNVAELELKSALEEAANDVKVRYAKANAMVAKSEYTSVAELNRASRDTVPVAEERRKKLAYDAAQLQVEQSALESKLGALKADAKAAEVEAAKAALDRRQIRAPISGVVVEVVKRRGEWVQPGDSVVRIVHLENLWVEGFLDADQFETADVANCEVTVWVDLPHGREKFQGKIAHASPIVEAGQFLVRAQVRNIQDRGEWILRPGLVADMEIHVQPPRREKSSPTAAQPRRARSK